MTRTILQNEGQSQTTGTPPSLPTKLFPAELRDGALMTREEFHRLYEQTPEDFGAELIGGIVHVSSPLKRPHSKHHLFLGAVFAAYEGNTPGVDAGDNAS